MGIGVGDGVGVGVGEEAAAAGVGEGGVQVGGPQDLEVGEGGTPLGWVGPAAGEGKKGVN